MAQTARATGAELQYVVHLSRHGVRSPTGKPSQYSQYSATAWPEWPVQPGYLTPHGSHLIELFGEYDRAQLAGEGLLSPKSDTNGCSDAAKITSTRTPTSGRGRPERRSPGD